MTPIQSIEKDKASGSRQGMRLVNAARRCSLCQVRVTERKPEAYPSCLQKGFTPV